MDAKPDPPASRFSVPPRVAAISIILFWAFYFASVTARRAIMGDTDFYEVLDNRVMVSLCGMGFTWLLYLYLRRLDHKSLRIRVAAVFLASVPVAAAYAATNYWSFYVFDPLPDFDPGRYPEKTPAMMISESAIHWYYFILSWSVFYLALSYAAVVRESEREAARLRAAAQSAEIRALRYQVNPHFFFNTLNSLSSLILSDRKAQAEAMILKFAHFFRNSLSADPTEDVPLADEVALQRLYLDIETVRFPDRLSCTFDIPEVAARACVPGMILQPLIENAVKYAVAPARRPVTIAVRATVEGETLRIAVEDNGHTVGTAPGTGVGLRNVRDRLAARYGDAARFEAAPRPSGGFSATLTLPLVRHGC